MALSITGIKGSIYGDRPISPSDIPQVKMLLSDTDGGALSDTVAITVDGVVKSARAVHCNKAGTIYTCPVGQTTFVPEVVTAGQDLIGLPLTLQGQYLSPKLTLANYSET